MFIHLGAFEIESGSLEDTIYLQGYLHAHEHLFAMDFTRRSALGQLSELFGDSKLQEDKFFRSLNLIERVDRDWATASDEEKLLLDAYSKGVNDYIAQLSPISLPAEYLALYGLRFWLDRNLNWHDSVLRMWRPQDCLVVARLRDLQTNHGWTHDLTRYLLQQYVNDTAIHELFEDTINENIGIGEGVGEETIHLPGMGGSLFAGKSPSGVFLAADLHRSVRTSTSCLYACMYAYYLMVSMRTCGLFMAAMTYVWVCQH